MTTTAISPANQVDKPGRIPYERIVQWLAGPAAIIAGAIAVWLDNHFGLLGKAGLGKDQTAKAIFDGITFVVGAGLTYLSHAKWMSNLVAWWQTQATNQEGSIVVTEEQQETETTEEPQTEPAEQPDEPEAPFVDEPGYDEPGPGVEPDQDVDES